MATVLIDEQCVIPAGIATLADFRRWAVSPEFPAAGRIDWVASRIEVDMSPEDLFTGETRVSNSEADLSVEPDVVIMTDATVDAGRVRLVPAASGKPDRFIELEDRPDLVIEIIIDSSLAKDTRRLPAASHKADPLHHPPAGALRLHRRSHGRGPALVGTLRLRLRAQTVPQPARPAGLRSRAAMIPRRMRSNSLARLPALGLLLLLLGSGFAHGDGDDVQVAAYYFPNWGPIETSEWGLIKWARPQFAGHLQPKVPAWGFENENDPAVMARKIEAAASHGVDAFIFDWYFFDPQPEAKKAAGYSPWDGQKYLSRALEQGFLEAPNNGDIRFAIMWCNHDVGPAMGAVTPATFETLAEYVTATYFPHPSYWKLDGKPYFSIYDTKKFLESFGNDLDAAAAALDRFRERARAAGFPGLHVNAVLFGLPKDTRDDVIRRLGFDSTTSYVWIHHAPLADFPATDYAKAANAYFRAVTKGGGYNGLKQPAATLPVPYHPNVSMGWDSSPRCRNAPDWVTRRDYPYGAVIVNNTPEAFREALERARPLAEANPPGQRVVTINSWNEWGEGSYIEPDTTHGMGHLEAIRDVFPPPAGRPNTPAEARP